jgi:RNA polymerase subunit RPABC4/transcription elongation factor Spt4
MKRPWDAFVVALGQKLCVRCQRVSDSQSWKETLAIIEGNISRIACFTQILRYDFLLFLLHQVSLSVSKVKV